MCSQITSRNDITTSLVPTAALPPVFYHETLSSRKTRNESNKKGLRPLKSVYKLVQKPTKNSSNTDSIRAQASEFRSLKYNEMFIGTY